MRQLEYQQLIFGYHGCDLSVRDRVLKGEDTLKPSTNEYDWLGEGIYFWESGKARALEWANQLKARKKIHSPSVLGAVIQLGNCFDLLDSEYTDVLELAYPEFEIALAASNKKLPKNTPLGRSDPDLLLRRADCAVVNWTISRFEKAAGFQIQSVRGVFQEGKAVFPGSGIKRRSHIQIAIRDTACIVGYFLPQ